MIQQMKLLYLFIQKFGVDLQLRVKTDLVQVIVIIKMKDLNYLLVIMHRSGQEISQLKVKH